MNVLALFSIKCLQFHGRLNHIRGEIIIIIIIIIFIAFITIRPNYFFLHFDKRPISIAKNVFVFNGVYRYILLVSFFFFPLPLAPFS
jgi:hypothetical protein